MVQKCAPPTRPKPPTSSNATTERALDWPSRCSKTPGLNNLQQPPTGGFFGRRFLFLRAHAFVRTLAFSRSAAFRLQGSPNTADHLSNAVRTFLQPEGA